MAVKDPVSAIAANALSCRISIQWSVVSRLVIGLIKSFSFNYGPAATIINDVEDGNLYLP